MIYYLSVLLFYWLINWYDMIDWLIAVLEKIYLIAQYVLMRLDSEVLTTYIQTSFVLLLL